MPKNKIFNKKIGLALGTIGVLLGLAILVGVAKGNSATVKDSDTWDSKPVIVNVQVDLEKEGDQTTVYNILNEIEKYNGHTTVFVTGEFASKHPEVVRDIEARKHQIAVHGWQKREDLTLLNVQEQLELIQRAFSAVRSAVDKSEEVVDFKPQGYKFNDDTIRILQEIGAKSMSGIFSCQESFCKCWYAQQLGKITFPYPITNEFWAIPISEVNIDSKDIPLDDEYIDNPQSFLNYLIEKYNQQTETKDPLIFVVHPSIARGDEVKLSVLSQFLDYVEKNNGRIKPLSSITHQTTYITDFDVISSTTTAAVGDEITISGGYTSNIYCPHYRFRVYGKYKESTEGWEKLGSYCEFVYTGTHPLSWKVKIPPIPQIIPPPEKYVYQIKIVGKASYGGCGESELWPTPDSYQAGAMEEVEVEVKPNCRPIPNSEIGIPLERINLLFVPDDDYQGNIQNFLQDVNNLIDNNYGGIAPISENLNRFNFYYTELEGDANTHPHTLPTNLDCKYDEAVILHVNCSIDWTDHGLTVFSAEGEDEKCIPQHSFIHESGHAVFELADEYTETRQPPDCTDYTLGGLYPNIVNPNIWLTKDNCESDAAKEGWSANRCNNFCPSTNSCCGTGWWRIDRTPSECNGLNDCDEVMIDNDDGFGVACQRRINYVFDILPQMMDILYPCPWCPKYAEKLAENSVSLYLNINNDQLTLLQSEFSESSPPNYYPGDYPFRAEIISLTGELLGKYGFGDPRLILGEIGYEGPSWIDNVDFPLILPYFHNAKTINILNRANELLLSVDIAQYDKGIMEGKITDYNGNPVLNAFLQIGGTSEGSTYTNENGEYQLLVEPGYYEIGVTPDTYANLMPAFASISVSAGEIVTRDFILNPAGSIGGTVTDVNENPVPNVNVYLSGYETPHYATNEEGKYIIPGLQAGTYTVNVDTSGTIFVDTWATAEVILGQTTILDFVLMKGGTISGKVTNKEGSTISGAYVYVSGPSYGSSYTDEDGYYSISRLLEGTYTVRGCPPYGLNLVCASVIAEVKEGETTIVDIILPEGGIIVGRITDPEGNGVSNLYVYAYGPSWGYSYTDEQGYYSITGLENGTYTVQVYTWGTIFVDASAMVEVVAGQTTTLDFVLVEGGRITGRVTDTNGIGIANVYLYAYGPSYGDDYTDEEGNYSVVGLRDGNYTVNIYAPGYGRWYILVNDALVKYGNLVTVEVVLGQTTWVDFTQQPQPAPNIWLDPQSFEIILPQGGITNKTLIIGNDGVETLKFEITDKEGVLISDSSEGGWIDIKQIFADLDSQNVNFLVKTYTDLPDYFWGNLWLDIDQDPLTGVSEQWWPGRGLNDIGADYVLEIYRSWDYSQVYLYKIQRTDEYFWWEFVSSFPISLDRQYFAFSIPLSNITDDGILDFTFMMEWWYYDYGIDIVPDEGHGTTKILADWLLVSPASGIIDPGEQTEAIIAVNTTNLEVGEYRGFIIINSNDIDEGVIYIPVNLTVEVGPIPATIGCDPDSLNLKSKGEWITCYIELPASYDVWQIDGSTVLLNDTILAYLGKQGWAKAESNESNIMDHDGDGILERMVKFNRPTVQSILEVGDEIKVTISGKLINGKPFEGSDIIGVINQGKK